LKVDQMGWLLAELARRMRRQQPGHRKRYVKLSLSVALRPLIALSAAAYSIQR
jgi:hypothetical protein